MNLTNGILSLEFDSHNGSILSLFDRRTGFEHLSSPKDATLFRLIAPAETWQSRYIESHHQDAHLDKKGGRLTIRYDALKTAPVDTRGNCDLLPVKVVVTVEIPPGSAEAIFSMEIENNSQSPLVEAWFPKLGGWTGYSGPDHDRLTPGYQGYFDQLNPHAPILGTDWTTFMRWDRRWSVRYPWATFLPWLDVSDGSKGLWLINYMQQAYMGGFAAESLGAVDDLNLTFGWFSIIEIAPGCRWVSQRFGLGVHQGDWHATARRYRDWLKTWWQPVEPPERLKRSLGIQHVIFKNFDGEPVRSFSQLPAVARAGMKYGIPDVCIWDYLMLGTYGRTNGSAQTDYPQEQWEELRQAIAATRKMGSSVSMLINNRLVSPTSHFYTHGGSAGAMRMRDGSLRPEPTPVSGRSAETIPHWMGPQALVMCQRSQEFRREVNRQLDRLMEVGFDAFFIDQSFELLPCYDAQHGHTRPDDTHQAAIEWIGDFRRKLKQQHPDGYLMGEMPDVFTPQVLDIQWNWNWFRRGPEMMAYSMPKMYNAWVTDRNIDFAQKGFLYGLLLMFTTHGLEGTLDDDPPFGQYIQKLADLRARTAYCTVGAEFQDCDDLLCEGGTARRYLHAGGDCVVLVNPSQKAAKSKLQIGALQAPSPTNVQARPAPSRVYRLDGSTQQAAWGGDKAVLEIELNPYEVVVWDLGKAQ